MVQLNIKVLLFQNATHSLYMSWAYYNSWKLTPLIIVRVIKEVEFHASL